MNAISQLELSSVVAWLATTSASAEQRRARQTTGRAPNRSEMAPQAKPPRPSPKNQRRRAEIPVRDQSVSSDIGSRKIASENIAAEADTGHQRAGRRSPNDRKIRRACSCVSLAFLSFWSEAREMVAYSMGLSKTGGRVVVRLILDPVK